MRKTENLGDDVTVKREYTNDETPILILEEWYLNHQLHREDGPAHQQWEIVNGQHILVLEVWWLNDKWHRVNGPAYQRWEIVNNEPILIQEVWWLNNNLHRVDGPAVQRWEIVNSEPILTWEVWRLNNNLHRVDGPAYRKSDIIQGQPVLIREEWYLNHQLHRDGYLPATLQGQYRKRGVRYELDQLKRYGRIILRFMKRCRVWRRRRQWATGVALKNRYGFRDVVSVIVGYV